MKRVSGSPAAQPFVDETGAPATLPEMGNGGDESKLKVLLGLLRKYVLAFFFLFVRPTTNPTNTGRVASEVLP
jgi:hypothetical protein